MEFVTNTYLFCWSPPVYPLPVILTSVLWQDPGNRRQTSHLCAPITLLLRPPFVSPSVSTYWRWILQRCTHRNTGRRARDRGEASERESLPTQVEADDEEFNVELSFYLPWVGRKIAGSTKNKKWKKSKQKGNWGAPMINKQQIIRGREGESIKNNQKCSKNKQSLVNKDLIR